VQLADPPVAGIGNVCRLQLYECARPDGEKR